MSRISETDLIKPALQVMKSYPNGTISTTNLIVELTKIMKPNGEDLEILKDRNDTKFSQKVRNLKSHNTLNMYATYTPPASKSESGHFTINETGLLYLDNIV